jgi:N-acetylmuramoyl-L-alanine amidase
MAPALWAAGMEYGIDPVGMVAQSGKETGWGQYPGAVRDWFYNTAGIKVRYIDRVRALVAGITGVPVDQVSADHPLVHAQFPNWTVGAMAHAQHLRAYAGSQIVGLVVDPRYTLVGPPYVSTWAGLGGRWAPSATYGTEIEAIMERLASGLGNA